MDPGRAGGGGVAPPDVGGSPPVAELGDEGLIAAGLEAVLTENRARARRLDVISRFHARRVAEADEGRPDEPYFFRLTPLEATKAEFGPLLGVPEMFIAADIDFTNDLKRLFPVMWGMCLAGRLDLGRARVVHEQLANLTTEEDKAAYAEAMEECLLRQDEPAAALHPVPRKNLQRTARRKCLKYPQRGEQATYAEEFRKRRVHVRVDDSTGVATLSCRTSAHEAMLADHRLTLIAKKLREAEGEERTVDQLRADIMVDLIQGRLTVGASDGELSQDSTDDGADPATTFRSSPQVGGYARPVINVTVPVTSLMGLDETPGVMAGGSEIPAELVRKIAHEPGSVWHRLLTDPLGGFVELSTKSYSPTDTQFKVVVARDRCCIWPGCSRPSTVVEIDHRTPWPEGRTTVMNLQPLCERHHKVKHSQGFSVVREDDGSYTWTSRFGSTFRTPAGEFPTVEWPDPVGEESEPEPAGAEPPVFSGTRAERRFAELTWRCSRPRQTSSVRYVRTRRPAGGSC